MFGRSTAGNDVVATLIINIFFPPSQWFDSKINLNLFPEIFEKFVILSKIDKNHSLESCVLELCRTAMIKPRQIDHFFSSVAQRTNSSLQTGLRCTGCLGMEKSRFSDRELGKVHSRTLLGSHY